MADYVMVCGEEDGDCMEVTISTRAPAVVAISLGSHFSILYLISS